MKLEKIVSLNRNRVVAYEVLYQDLGGVIDKEKIFMTLKEEEDLEVFLFHLHRLKEMVHQKALPSPPRFFLNIKPSTIALYGEKILTELQYCPFSVVLELREDWIDERHFARLVAMKNSFNFLLSLDDFGKASSNLDRYIKLKPHFTKIDFSVFERTSSSFFFFLLEALKKGGESVFVAEKVESEEQLKLVKTLSIDFVQGYLFSNGYRPF